MEAVKSGWDCIEWQDTAIVRLCHQVATLERDVLNLEKEVLEKDHKIFKLQSQLETAQHGEKREKKQTTFYCLFALKP